MYARIHFLTRMTLLTLVVTVCGCSKAPSAERTQQSIYAKAELTSPETPATVMPQLEVKVKLPEPDPPAPQINIELKIPTPLIQPSIAFTAKPGTTAQDDISITSEKTTESVARSIPPVSELEQDQDASADLFLGKEIRPGELMQTTWSAGEALHGAQIPTPVLMITGKRKGPTLCITAAVHGDELNGIEAVRQLMYTIKPKKLTGTVIGVPIVNIQGFLSNSRYLSDRRDLNRFFPGRPKGSAASRMAHSFFTDVIKHCDSLVDLHTGSFHRTNLPQLRADLNNPEVLTLTRGFGSTVILHSIGAKGTLRHAAVEAGIPAVTFEAGEPLRLQESAVKHIVRALFTLLDTLEMYNKRSFWGKREPTYYSSRWVRADHGGILFSSIKLGKRVKKGDLLGKITDPITNEQADILAPHAGRVIGRALNQFVMPGFATFHLATEAKLDSTAEDDHYDSSSLDIAASATLNADEFE